VTKLDWSKVKADDARRRNAPLRTTTTKRFIMRARHAGICPACGCRWAPLDQITPVGPKEAQVWVHWNKSLRCARRQEARNLL
jgi:hypothetical protein